MVLTWIAAITGYAISVLSSIAHFYIGYSVTFTGSIIGGIWGFFDAFICLWLFAKLYNWLGK